MVRTKVDKSGLSIISKVTFKIASSLSNRPPQLFEIIGAYIPPRASNTSGPCTLHQRLQHYLTNSSSDRYASITPRVYGQTVVQKWCLRAQAQGRFVGITGDLNGTADLGSSNSIRDWLSTLHVRAPLSEQLLPQQEYFTFFNGTMGISRIDHVLHSPPPSNYSVTEFGVFNSPAYAHVFEHRPVWLGFAISNLEPPPMSTPHAPAPRLEIHKGEEPHYSDFQEQIELWTEVNLPDERIALASMDELSNLLAALSTASLSCVAKVKSIDKKRYLQMRCQGKRAPLKDGYSPDMRLIQDAMHLLIRLRMAAYGPGHHARWHHSSSYGIILPMVTKWQAKLYTQHPSDHDADPLGLNSTALQMDLQPMSLLRTRHSDMTRAFFDSRIAKLRNKLHGRLRSQLRLKMSKRVKDMQLCLEQNKIRDVLHKLGNKQRQALDHSFLQLDDSTITTNPIEIHQKLSEHFEVHHEAPVNLDPIAHQMQEDPNFWRQLVNPPVSRPPSGRQSLTSTRASLPTQPPSPLHHLSKIPKDLQDKLRTLCKRKVDDSVVQALQSALDAEITFDHFDGAIDSLIPNKAPGPSGLSTSMVKAWPCSTRKAAYKILARLWENKSIPIWWGDKLLCGLPKKANNSTLANVRPIGLLEVLRKLWTSLIVCRIQDVWEKHQVLHHAQSGYRWRRSTSTAIIQLTDAIEAARHQPDSDPLFATFWDYKAAFDSIPRNLMRLAWARLGVPDEYVQWLTNLDEEGLTFFLSPYMANKLQTRQEEDLLSSPTDYHLLLHHMLGFHTQRGVTQGDTMATICWVAIFDMILTWCDPENTSSDVAYADDMVTLTSDLSLQQTKADLISSFCAFSGMAISIPKIETICIQHPDAPPILSQILTIRDWKWEPTAIPIARMSPNDSTKYLGARVTFGHQEKQSYQWCRDHIRTTTAILQMRRATGQCRQKVIEVQLIPQILYVAAHATWPLKYYKELDRILAHAIRQMYHLPHSYPADLIFLPKTDCGLNFKRISDMAQVQKWGMLGRTSALGSVSAAAVNSIIKRASITLPPTVLFGTSLIEWGVLNKMQLSELASGARSLSTPVCQSLIEKLQLTPEGVAQIPIGGIFSDGAFTPANVTPMALLTHPSQLLQIGRGGIAVVWTPPPSQLLLSPTRILHVTMPSSQLQRTTPNTLELLGQIIAYKLSSHVPTHIAATSDCLSVVHSMQEAQGYRRRPFGHTAKGIFYESVALSELVPRPTRWTRSHPERRLSDRSQWTYEDKGIHIADAAADSAHAPTSEVLRNAPPIIHEIIQCDDLLRELLADGVWHWTYADSVDNIPILDDLMRHVNYCSLLRYVDKRDRHYRAKAELPPKWVGINPNLAYSCLPEAPTNTRQYIQNAGRIWHKSFRYGSNRVKVSPDSPTAQAASQCSHCHRVENPSHIYAQCRNPLLRQLRESIFDSLLLVVQRTQLDPTCPQWERAFFSKLHKHSFSPYQDKAEQCWNGTLNQSTLRRLLGSTTSETSLSFDQFKNFRKRFVSFVNELSQMATQMELVQQQTRASSALATLPRISRRINHPAPASTPRPIHPAFLPRTPAPQRSRSRRIPAPPPTARILTQTRFQMPAPDSQLTTGLIISLTTISHHEHLASTYSEFDNSSSDRAFYQTESTEPSPPLGLQPHEAPD